MEKAKYQRPKRRYRSSKTSEEVAEAYLEELRKLSLQVEQKRERARTNSKRSERSYKPIYTSAHFEAVLIVLAYLSKVDGLAALEQFERCERSIATMKRVEALIEKLGIKSTADWDKHLKKAGQVIDEAEALHWA